jgi:hypothetical protein
MEARPFRTFHNIAEYGPDWTPPTEPFEVTAKLDGSLGITYLTPDGIQIATSGSFTSNQALHATNVFQNRSSHRLGPFNRPLQRRIFDKIYYGECDTASWGEGVAWCECVLVNDVPVFMLCDYLKRELVTVIPLEDWRIAKYLRWRRWTLRQKIALANPHDKRLGRRITNQQVVHDLAVSPSI